MNGVAVMFNMEAYEELRFDSHVYDMLLEGELEAEATETWFSPEEALDSMRAALLRDDPLVSRMRSRYYRCGYANDGSAQ